MSPFRTKKDVKSFFFPFGTFDETNKVIKKYADSKKKKKTKTERWKHALKLKMKTKETGRQKNFLPDSFQIIYCNFPLLTPNEMQKKKKMKLYK